MIYLVHVRLLAIRHLSVRIVHITIEKEIVSYVVLRDRRYDYE